MNFADLVGGSAKSYTFLYTTDVDSVLVAEDNSMIIFGLSLMCEGEVSLRPTLKA